MNDPAFLFSFWPEAIWLLFASLALAAAIAAWYVGSGRYSFSVGMVWLFRIAAFVFVLSAAYLGEVVRFHYTLWMIR